MICPNCRKEIDNDSRFCENCGYDTTKKKSNAGLIIGIVLGALVLLGGIGFGVWYLVAGNNDDDYSNFPDEDRIHELIETLTNSADNNSFSTIEECYAYKVERYQSKYDTDRDFVMNCYRDYDETFKVYNKYTNIRWETFSVMRLNDSTAYVEYIEDYHIDRAESGKFTDFVLKKHVKINRDYQIISIYDDQLERRKSN